MSPSIGLQADGVLSEEFEERIDGTTGDTDGSHGDPGVGGTAVDGDTSKGVQAVGGRPVRLQLSTAGARALFFRYELDG